MHAAACAPLLVALGLFAGAALCAQQPDRPPIFTARPALDVSESPVRDSPPRATPAVSNHVRAMINAAAMQVLEDAAIFEAPASAGAVSLDRTTGTMVMAPVVVRGKTLRDSQVRPPVVRLYHFVPVGGDKHRRIAGGATAALYHTFIGKKEFQVDLSVFNLGGKGIDHNIDFSRAEVAFTFKW